VKGTALAGQPPLPDEEILTTIAVFRFILPTAFIRFAGGRRQMSAELQRRALRAGINASLVGGLLTTPGTDVEEDYRMFAEAGYAPL
jgi:biotin synthase-like enzyme